MPYFAYCSVLHLKETFGERNGDRIRTHYVEADNELHHLLIMEELAEPNPSDRLIAQTIACAFYWYAVAVYACAPRAAYHLSELIEAHAYATYDKYLTANEAALKMAPVPQVARDYYESSFFLHLRSRGTNLTSLYDVFTNVRDDEQAHWTTLCALVQFDDTHVPDGVDVEATLSSSEQ